METLFGELSQSSNADTVITTSNEAVNEDLIAFLQRRLRLEIDAFRHLKEVSLQSETSIFDRYA